MPAYVIGIRSKLNDPEEMKTYAAKAREARGTHAFKVLVGYGDFKVLEGAESDGIVLLEFADMAAAEAWYRDPAYQDALEHRKNAGDYQVILVEGVKPAG